MEYSEHGEHRSLTYTVHHLGQPSSLEWNNQGSCRIIYQEAPCIYDPSRIPTRLSYVSSLKNQRWQQQITPPRDRSEAPSCQEHPTYPLLLGIIGVIYTRMSPVQAPTAEVGPSAVNASMHALYWPI